MFATELMAGPGKHESNKNKFQIPFLYLDGDVYISAGIIR